MRRIVNFFVVGFLVRRHQQRKIFQPERGAFGVGSAEHPRLHDLAVSADVVHGQTMRLAILKSDTRDGGAEQQQEDGYLAGDTSSECRIDN